MTYHETPGFLDPDTMKKGQRCWAIVDGKPQEITFTDLRIGQGFYGLTESGEIIMDDNPAIFATDRTALINIHIERAKGQIAELRGLLVELEALL